MELFAKSKVVGVFRSFREGGMEFHAELALPYHRAFHQTPMHGQFLIVQLATPEEAVLGRITSLSAEGKLSSGVGEEYNIRAMQAGEEVPDDLRKEYLKYRVNIRVLGVLRNGNQGLLFSPSHRRLPHVGSRVAFLTDDVLQEICGHNVKGAAIGHFALGEYVYDAEDKAEALVQSKKPENLVKFPMHSLVARRSFIFARAGFGKSNLNKLLFSKLYETTPKVKKRDGEKPVGTIIFDPDGEYFWPDDKGRPGLCDVPHLQDKLVVFTNRKAPSAFYESFTADGVKLDLRQFPASDVISIAVAPERQDQQNVIKLRSLSRERWHALIDLIDQDSHWAETEKVAKIMGLDPKTQEVEASAARSNMAHVVRMLHDKSSQFKDSLIGALEAGKICVVDVSSLRGGQAFILGGLLLRRIFDRNQREFTRANPQTIPVIAVIEEAQAVLNERATSAEPYIAWVKEGRKYDLGALLITQQPGSIPNEILSQGDNWFLFHLLSAGDLANVRRANSHFSDDLLASLLNEPIPGQGVFWSSVGGKPYPVAFRALLFESMYEALDPNDTLGAVKTFATQLTKAKERVIEQARKAQGKATPHPPSDQAEDDKPVAPDLEAYYRQLAVRAVKGNKQVMQRLQGDGMPWYGVQMAIADALPKTVENRIQGKAYELVPPTMTKIFGPEPENWHTRKGGPSGSTYIKAGPDPSQKQD